MILVLNAGGNIGKELVRELHSRSADFVAGFRSAEQVSAAESGGTRAVVADYSRPDTLRAALSGVKKVFFVTPPVLNLEDLEGNVLEAAQAAGVEHLVKMSVWGADTGGFVFAQPHQAVENRIATSGIPYTFLRPTGFMQNMLGNAATIKSQGAFYLPAGDARVAEIDCRDIASVAAVALTEDGHTGKAYELSGPEAMTYTERAKILSEVLGKPVAYVSTPDADWKKTMLGYGLPEWQVDGILDLLRYYKTGQSERVSPAVEEVTGVKPITYRQFAQDYSDAFR
jgi:uncharacterized protein YbjT (DUF2867 family)